jgi:hypothetical protein
MEESMVQHGAGTRETCVIGLHVHQASSNIMTRNNTAGCNTMAINSVTALMTSHNIVTRNNTAGCNTMTINSATALMTSRNIMTSNNTEEPRTDRYIPITK